jgi:hypothetical protein
MTHLLLILNEHPNKPQSFSWGLCKNTFKHSKLIKQTFWSSKAANVQPQKSLHTLSKEEDTEDYNDHEQYS